MTDLRSVRLNNIWHSLGANSTFSSPQASNREVYSMYFSSTCRPLMIYLFSCSALSSNMSQDGVRHDCVWTSVKHLTNDPISPILAKTSTSYFKLGSFLVCPEPHLLLNILCIYITKLTSCCSIALLESKSIFISVTSGHLPLTSLTSGHFGHY